MWVRTDRAVVPKRGDHGQGALYEMKAALCDAASSTTGHPGRPPEAAIRLRQDREQFVQKLRQLTREVAETSSGHGRPQADPGSPRHVLLTRPQLHSAPVYAVQWIGNGHLNDRDYGC